MPKRHYIGQKKHRLEHGVKMFRNQSVIHEQILSQIKLINVIEPLVSQHPIAQSEHVPIPRQGTVSQALRQHVILHKEVSFITNQKTRLRNAR